MTHELVLERTLNASKEKLYRCWTEPELLRQWFAPKPVVITEVDLDVRPGGQSRFTMRLPNGQEMPNSGVYLEVVPNQKLVLTDALRAGWLPSEGTPFMVSEVTFEDAGDGKTRYRAVARHWTAEAKAQHEQMGFHEGWGQCTTQLEELAQSL